MNKEIRISPRQIAKSIDDLLDDRNDLQQRIDKAIDFINNQVDPEPWSFYKGKAFYDLLYILKGSDKND